MVKNLKNGVEASTVDYEEEDVLLQLIKEGLVYKTVRNGKTLYRLSNNVKVSRTNEGFTFEMVPNRHLGVIFDYCDLFDCVSEGKEAPEIYCLTYQLNPNEDDIKNFNLGDEVRVKVLARGYDLGNEGLSLRLPRSEEDFFAMEKDPFLTLGLAQGAKSRNTALLEFDEPISGQFITGRKSVVINGKPYFDLKDIDAVKSVYTLQEKYGQYVVKKTEEKSIITKGRK
jgi:hypothetical protein